MSDTNRLTDGSDRHSIPMSVNAAAERVLTEYKKGYPGSGTGIDRQALWAAFDDLEAALAAEQQARLSSDYTPDE